MIHDEPHPLARRTVTIQPCNDSEFAVQPATIVIEDWWDRVGGGSWMDAAGNPACLLYAMRIGMAENPPPIDDEVVYGKTPGRSGVLVHVSEIVSEVIE